MRYVVCVLLLLLAAGAIAVALWPKPVQQEGDREQDHLDKPPPKQGEMERNELQVMVIQEVKGENVVLRVEHQDPKSLQIGYIDMEVNRSQLFFLKSSGEEAKAQGPRVGQVVVGASPDVDIGRQVAPLFKNSMLYYRFGKCAD